MKALGIFLNVLNNRMKGTRGLLIPRLTKKPCKFGAVQKYTIEIWCIDNSIKTLISSSSRTESIDSKEKEEEVIDSLIQETIDNILKRYGL